MKQTIILLAFLSVVSANAQWSITGNSSTTPSTSTYGTPANNNFFGTLDAKDVVFATNGLERMRLTSTGNVLIDGTLLQNNDVKLKVVGRIVANASAASDFVDFVNNADNIPSGSDALWVAYSKYQNNNVGLITLSSIPSLGAPYETRFTVRANGKAGFGTENFSCSDCTDYRLFVKDGIRTEKVKVDIAANNGWADYVFKKDYKLMPLNDLEKFININGHLPEVPTTDEAIENGIELKSMNILLLKKVEELTLHTISQQNKIDDLYKRIDSLEKLINK